jgi:hypothetical protein
VVAERAFGQGARIPVEFAQFVRDLSMEEWHQPIAGLDALGPHRGAPAGAGLLCRRVFQLEQVLDDAADAVADRSPQGSTQVLDLLDHVLEVQFGEAPRAQQIRLTFGPC